MDFRQLKSFSEVVRQGSFTRAAETLYISQPTISLHIRELEKELGVSLIHRSTRSIELTDKGREIFEYAEGILTLRDRIGSACLPGSQKLIRIGASTIPSSCLLPDVIADFLKVRKDVVFDITQSDSRVVAEGVFSHLYDLGFTGMPSQRPELIEEAVARDHLVLITPADGRFKEMKTALDSSPAASSATAEGASPDISAGLEAPAPYEKQLPDRLRELLLSEPFIQREEGSGSLDKAASLLEHVGISLDSLRVTVRTNDQEAILALVAAGAGISILSGQAARTFAAEGRILCFDLAPSAGGRDLFLLYSKYDTLPEHVRDFVRFVREADIRTRSIP